MIKTLLFDFGDIFINLDKLKPYEEFKKIGFREPTTQMLQRNEDFEIGGLSSEAFCEYYIKHSVEKINVSQVKHAWNSILLDFPEHRLKFIEDLASVKNFNLILLSNTNELHIDWIKEHVPFYYEFKACFNKFYLSHEIHLRKPNQDIYEFVLTENNLLPQEILFIDDTKENTQAAKTMGFHVWNLDPKTEDVVDLFATNRHLF